MAKRDKKTITLGSGIPYIMEFSGTLPSRTDICKPENLLGYVKGGAALEYTMEPYKEKDDLGYVSKEIVTEEEAKLKLGLLTWNGEQLKYLVDRCKVTDDEGVRTVLLGGAGNAQGKQWVVCFHHPDKKTGDLWVTVVGNNSAGLTLTFAADAGTVLEPEISAVPQDDQGTLVKIEEEKGTAAT